MDLVAATIERLQALRDAQDKAVYLDVFGAIELAAIIEQGNPQRDRTAYVVLNSELPSEPVTGTGPATQRVVVDVVVVTALKAVNSALGASTTLEVIRKALRAELFDWTPDADANEPYTLGGGKLLTFRNGWIYWADSFRSDVYI